MPRIRIAPTLANDFSLMIQLLPMGRELASLVTDPRAFLADHRAELRFLDQLGRAQLKRLRPASAHPAGVEKTEETAPPDAGAPALVRRQMVMLR